ITVLGTNDAPTITGAVGGLAITDKQTIAPFTNVVIGELDAFGLQVLTVTVSLDNFVKGILTNRGGFSNSAPGVYTITGVASNITASIRGLVFVPTENRIPVNTSETTFFTIM